MVVKSRLRCAFIANPKKLPDRLHEGHVTGCKKGMLHAATYLTITIAAQVAKKISPSNTSCRAYFFFSERLQRFFQTIASCSKRLIFFETITGGSQRLQRVTLLLQFA